jgi:hypothetical protein
MYICKRFVTSRDGLKPEVVSNVIEKLNFYMYIYINYVRINLVNAALYTINIYITLTEMVCTLGLTGPKGRNGPLVNSGVRRQHPLVTYTHNSQLVYQS